MIDTQVNSLGIRAQPLTQQLGIGDIHSTDKLGLKIRKFDSFKHIIIFLRDRVAAPDGHPLSLLPQAEIQGRRASQGVAIRVLMAQQVNIIRFQQQLHRIVKAYAFIFRTHSLPHFKSLSNFAILALYSIESVA